jgi:hypothetical protein
MLRPGRSGRKFKVEDSPSVFSTLFSERHELLVCSPSSVVILRVLESPIKVSIKTTYSPVHMLTTYTWYACETQ